MPSVSVTFVTIHVRQSAQAVPLAAATIAASLPEKQRANLHLVDAYLCETDTQIIDKITQKKPTNQQDIHLICFSLYVWNRQRVLDVAAQLRQRSPSSILAIGGPEATACHKQLINLQLFDGVVSGEGELVLASIIESLGETGTFPPLHPITATVDMTQQRSPWLSGLLPANQGVLWETARGCPFNCAFCYDARGSHGVREIPLHRLEQELQLFSRQQVAQIWVLDSTFNYPPARGKELLRLIAKHAPRCHFHLEAKAEFLDHETVELLQQINCSVQVGLQSARPEVLRHINRALDVELFSTKLHLLSCAGITFGIDLIYGLPGDNLQGLRHSIDFALQFFPNQIEIFPLALLPGTQLHQNKQQHGLHAQEKPPYSVIKSNTMSPEQLFECEKLAAATTIFYNTGRAMAYFLPLCQACNLSPLQFIDSFSDWLSVEITEPEKNWWNIDWTAQQVLDLQKNFIAQLFTTQNVEHLIPLALDIMTLHSCWSDTMLGAETIAQPLGKGDMDVLNHPWQLAPTVTIKKFVYPVSELSALEELDLIEIFETIQPHASSGLFLRRGEEVFCEEIDEIFATLLTHSNLCATPQQILAHYACVISIDEFLEIVTFALSEGLLIPSNCSL